MVDPEKIRIMAQLAVYDKNFGEKDKKITSWFRHDYVYLNNFKTRIYVFIGLIIIFSLYALKLFFIDQADIGALDYRGEVYRAALFSFGVMAAYTLLSSVMATRSYTKSQKRVKHKLALMSRLDKLNSSINLKTGPEGTYYHGADFGNSGSNRKPV